jgi:hypothetical protein
MIYFITQEATNHKQRNETMSNAQARHEAEILAEIKGMSGRKEIEQRMAAEENTFVRLVIWNYLQTL